MDGDCRHYLYYAILFAFKHDLWVFTRVSCVHVCGLYASSVPSNLLHLTQPCLPHHWRQEEGTIPATVVDATPATMEVIALMNSIDSVAMSTRTLSLHTHISRMPFLRAACNIYCMYMMQYGLSFRQLLALIEQTTLNIVRHKHGWTPLYFCTKREKYLIHLQ